MKHKLPPLPIYFLMVLIVPILFPFMVLGFMFLHFVDRLVDFWASIVGTPVPELERGVTCDGGISRYATGYERVEADIDAYVDGLLRSAGG